MTSYREWLGNLNTNTGEVTGLTSRSTKGLHLTAYLPGGLTTNADVGNTANYSYVRTLYDQELPSYTENEVMRTLNLTLDPSLLDSAITGVNDYRIQFALTTGSTTAFYTVSDVTLTWAPEPGTYAMWLGIGFMGAICYGRRGHQCLSSGA